MKSVHLVVFIFSMLGCLVLNGNRAEAADAWHNHMVRSAWERDMQDIGGDGSQIPRSMVYSPKNNYQTIFMGVDTAGIYRSDDGGATWQSKMKGMDVYFIKSIAVDPVNPDIVYALASLGGGRDTAQIGLYVSEDNGDNWTHQRYFRITTPPDNSHTIAIDPDSYDPLLERCGTIYIGANDGLYKTTDGGENYNKIASASIGSATVTSIQVHPTNSDVVAVATLKGVFKSLDAGATFVNISGGLPVFDSVYGVEVDPQINALSVDPTDPETMYATFDDPLKKTYKLFKKTASQDWVQLTNGVPTSGRFYEIIVHPAAPNILMLGVEWGWPYKSPYYSDDYGQTWRDTSGGKLIEDRFNLTAGDVANFIFHRLAFAPKPDDSQVWLASMNYGAIFKTEDAAQTWQWSNTNYGGARFINFQFNPNFSRHLVFGGIDMGVVTSFDGGQSFIKAIPPNGGNVTAMAIDPAGSEPEQTRVIASIGGTNPNQPGDLRVSTDGGRTFTIMNGTEGLQASNIMWNASNYDYIYAGGNISDDNGATWKKIIDPFRLTEGFAYGGSGALPAGWDFNSIGQNTSSAEVITFKDKNIVSDRLRFAIEQTSAFGSLPAVTYANKALSFSQTPIVASAALDSGTTAWTQQVLQLDNGLGSFIYTFIQNNGDGTYTTKYRIKDGSYDSGEIVIRDDYDSPSVNVRIIAAPTYVQISNGGSIVVPHNFANKTNYKLKLIGRSTAVDHTVYTYADDAAFNMVPVNVVGYDALDPRLLYGYDGMSLYKSVDFGTSWTRLVTHSNPDVTGFVNNFLNAVEMNAAGTKIYMGHNGGVYIYDIASNTETFKSTGDGFEWNVGGTFHVLNVAIDPTDDNIVYAGEFNLVNGNGQWVFKSTDAGETWAAMPADGLFGNGRVWGLGVDYSGRLFAGSDHGTFTYGELYVPDVPGTLTAVSASGSVELAWQPSQGAATYQLKRSEHAGGPYAVVKGGIAGTNYTDTGVDPGTTYYYVVSAGNLAGESGVSSEAAVKALPGILYESEFEGSDNTLPQGWSYTGNLASGASISDNRLRHRLEQSSAWAASSKVTYNEQRYDFYTTPLLAEAYLDPGTTLIGQSGIQLSDDAGNLIYVFEKTDRGVIYRIKDGSYDTGDLLIGTFPESKGTIKIKATPSELLIYRNGDLIETVSHDFVNRRNYKLELVGRSGSTGTGIELFADAVKVWKETYVNVFSGVNGTLPQDWANAGPSSSQAGIHQGSLRLNINQSSPFAASSVARKTDRTYSFGSKTINLEAYLKADSFSTTATQALIGLRQTASQNQIYLFVQNSGIVKYRIIDGQYDSLEQTVGTYSEGYGVFRLEVSKDSLNIYRNGIQVMQVPYAFQNTEQYTVNAIGRASTSGSYYVTADDVNIY
ncbi:hypothetical protein EBB07_04770 [Paenibacillaceae bacterium]|nr:hypothetical protein EBB07_04770 [Paenibacillaceae bacterium]